jgi:hypothetical protein
MPAELKPWQALATRLPELALLQLGQSGLGLLARAIAA